MHQRLALNDKRYLAERNGEVWKAYVAGETPNSIAERYDLTVATVYSICKKIRAEIPEPDHAELKLNALEMLHQLQAQIAAIALEDAPPAFTVTGKPLYNPETGEVVKDYRQKFDAVKLVLMTSERIAKILGLDAPLQTSITVSEAVREAILAERDAALAARPHLRVLEALPLETGVMATRYGGCQHCSATFDTSKQAAKHNKAHERMIREEVLAKKAAGYDRG